MKQDLKALYGEVMTNFQHAARSAKVDELVVNVQHEAERITQTTAKSIDDLARQFA